MDSLQKPSGTAEMTETTETVEVVAEYTPGATATPAPEAGTADLEVVEGELAEPISPYDDRARELARREATSAVELQVRAHPAMKLLDAYLAQRSTVADDAEMAQGDIIAQILGAQTIDDVLTPAEATHARDLIDVPLIVHGVKYQVSDYAEGSPRYAVMDATRGDTGIRGPVTCGAQSVLAQLARLEQLDAFPIRLMVIKATKRPTSKGHWPIRLAIVKGAPILP
jgi:hypothetical protein